MERAPLRRPAIPHPQERQGPALAARAEIARTADRPRARIGGRQRAQQSRLQLLNRLIVAEEEERRRIAREMHDQCGQDLTALRLHVGRLKAVCGGDPGMSGQVEALEALVAQLDQDIDFLVWELRPTKLDGLDLRTALANYLQHWSTRFGICAQLHATEILEDRLTSKIKSTLYRIAQEALTNVAKHAKAERVDVVLASSGNHVSLVVEDHGVGFDRGDTRITGQGLGLVGMRERVALVAGTLHIESVVGRGTTILVRVPAPVADRA